MLAKLLTNCAADALLTDCAGSKLLRNCPKMKIVFEWIASPVYISGYWTWTQFAGWSLTPDYWIWDGTQYVVNPVYEEGPGHFTGGWDLFTETTFLGRSLGWYADGSTAPYMLFEDFSANPPGGSGHEDYTVDLEKSHDDGRWGASTTIHLKADWFISAGTALTVSVTYNGVTQSKVISPSALRVIPTPLAPTDPIVTSVGLVTVDDNGAFTLL